MAVSESVVIYGGSLKLPKRLLGFAWVIFLFLFFFFWFFFSFFVLGFELLLMNSSSMSNRVSDPFTIGSFKGTPFTFLFLLFLKKGNEYKTPNNNNTQRWGLKNPFGSSQLQRQRVNAKSTEIKVFLGFFFFVSWGSKQGSSSTNLRKIIKSLPQKQTEALRCLSSSVEVQGWP